MPRADHRFTVTLHDRWTGEKFTVHLVQTEIRGRYWPKFNGRNSAKYPELTGTEVGRKVSSWLRGRQAKGFCPWDIAA